MIAGVLLTGGRSRRMGSPKATLRLGGETLAVRAARTLGAVCHPVVEAGGGWSGAPSVRDPGGGPVAGLVAACEALGWPAVVLVLGVDLPRADAALLRFLAGRPGVASVVPAVGGAWQPVCARYGPAALAAARAAGPTGGARSLRSLLAADPGLCVVAEEEWRAAAPGAALDDVDTPEAAAALGLRPAAG